MATSTTSRSALLSGAAKDDILGADGEFTFTIADLLGNDPGGAAKVDLAKQFFFGSTAADQLDQAKYLADHGITDNGDGSYTITDAGVDFDYFVQIGNKGTWSVAHVDVTAPEPVVEPHIGELKAQWTFENHTAAAGDNIGDTPTGFFQLNGWAADHAALYPEADDAFAFAGNLQVHGVDEHRALDTAASPGNIFLQATPEGRNGAVLSTNEGVDGGATMPDLVAGQTYHASVSILKQDYSDNEEMVDAGWGGTDPEAWVSFNFNGTLLDVRASEIDVGNEFVTFGIEFAGVEGEDHFSIMSHGTGDDNQGLLIDSIQIHEWVI